MCAILPHLCIWFEWDSCISIYIWLWLNFVCHICVFLFISSTQGPSISLFEYIYIWLLEYTGIVIFWDSIWLNNTVEWICMYSTFVVVQILFQIWYCVWILLLIQFGNHLIRPSTPFELNDEFLLLCSSNMPTDSDLYVGFVLICPPPPTTQRFHSWFLAPCCLLAPSLPAFLLLTSLIYIYIILS